MRGASLERASGSCGVPAFETCQESASASGLSSLPHRWRAVRNWDGRSRKRAANSRSRKQISKQIAKCEQVSAIYRLAHRLRLRGDRKSTRLNSSHGYISYAVFCLKKKKNNLDTHDIRTLNKCITAFPFIFQTHIRLGTRLIRYEMRYILAPHDPRSTAHYSRSAQL